MHGVCISTGKLIVGMGTLEIAAKKRVGSLEVPVVNIIVVVLDHYCGLLGRCKGWSRSWG